VISAVRRISCETAFLGHSREGIFADDEVLADALISVYTDHEPGSCFVAVAQDRVIGYIIGSTNAAALERAFGGKVMVSLVGKAFRRGTFLDGRNWRFFFAVLRSLLGGEFAHPVLFRDYPATLHINLADGFRGKGVGERLIKTYLDYLRSRGALGVHFGTLSERAGEFFKKMGFLVLHQGRRSYLKPFLGRDVTYYVFGMKL
jgi:GNAT superfamily N-acetyltransferase